MQISNEGPSLWATEFQVDIIWNPTQAVES